MHKLLFYYCFTVLLSCGSEQFRQTSKSDAEIAEELIEFNKNSAVFEEKVIGQYVKEHNLTMSKTGTGLWYMIEEEGTGEKLESGQNLTVEYVISMLNDSVCYSSKDKGPYQFRLGMSDVESGIHEVFFSSCNHEEDGYKLLEEGVQFKFQTLGEDGFAPAIGQYISFQVSIYDDQQKLIYTTDKKGVDKHEHFLFTHNKQGAIQRGLLQFEEGDSVSFVMNQAKFKEQFPKINVSPKNSSFRVELLFTFIEDKNERDNRIGALLNQAMLKEEVLISEYFETSGDREAFDKWGGMYIKTLKEGTKVTENENLAVFFEAYFLNGTKLDETTDASKIKFSYGENAQVIEGINRVISKIGVGGKAEVIIPSNLAFGDRGSTSEVVPPSTPLRYIVAISRDSTAIKI